MMFHHLLDSHNTMTINASQSMLQVVLRIEGAGRAAFQVRGPRAGGRGGVAREGGGLSKPTHIFRTEFVTKDFSLQGGAVVARRVHNPEAAGSIPAPAPNFGGAA
jgi:hypothetical protein